MNILIKKKNIAVTFWACGTVLQILEPYGLTDENSYVCAKSLRFRSVCMGISNSIVVNPLSELGESTNL